MPWESFADYPSIGKSKYLFYKDGELLERHDAVLSQETAESLVIENWVDCTNNECSDLTVNIWDGRDRVWYIEAIYNGVKDDSVLAKKKIASAYHIDGEWKLVGELLKEYKCQAGRGHQNYSDEFCM